MPAADLSLVPVAFDDPRAVRLTAAMVREMQQRYGDDGASPAEAGDFDPPGRFLVAEVGDAPVGCSGLRVLLETGTEQPEALGLYAAEGFVHAPPYGHFADDPRTRCMARDLAQGAVR